MVKINGDQLRTGGEHYVDHFALHALLNENKMNINISDEEYMRGWVIAVSQKLVIDVHFCQSQTQSTKSSCGNLALSKSMIMIDWSISKYNNYKSNKCSNKSSRNEAKQAIEKACTELNKLKSSSEVAISQRLDIEVWLQSYEDCKETL